MTVPLACHLYPDCHCMAGPCPNLPAGPRPAALTSPVARLVDEARAFREALEVIRDGTGASTASLVARAVLAAHPAKESDHA